MINLTNFGYTDFFQKQPRDDSFIPARVTAVHRERYKIITEHGETYAKLKGTAYNNIESATDFPAVGDFIMVKNNPIGDSVITVVLPRKSKFSRPDYSGHKVGYVKTILEQVVAANFDYVFIVVSLNNDFNLVRIERYITAAWQSGGTPVVILTKADLVTDFSSQLAAVRKVGVGVEVIAVSAVTGFGLDQLSSYLMPGTTLVFLGSSGVGKSSLLNALAGEEIMLVNTIREDDSKGRHTTTHRQLIMLPSGIMIIDTPGMRELGMWAINEGLGETFLDVEELFKLCKFTNCTHKSEPHCAVRTALTNGSLEQSRYDHYLTLKREARFNEAKAKTVERNHKKQNTSGKYSKSNRKIKGDIEDGNY